MNELKPNHTNKVEITECPRDAMQGMKDFIPTEMKVNYLNSLLNCGFDTLDFGSFVSPKAIPQMADTAMIVEKLIDSPTKLLSIVANERGADQAVEFDRIHYLGYPFSISETFQQRNTNASIEESLTRLSGISDRCEKNKKELVVYLSMGFGNPFGDDWSTDLLVQWANRLKKEFNISRISLSDTIGAASPVLVNSVFSSFGKYFDDIELSAHLHVKPENAKEIMNAAFKGGCRMFEGAIKGFGGCPMAMDDLTGNMPTEQILSYFEENNIETGINKDLFNQSFVTSSTIFH
jgi:hydroxymethylglutaryl-CoA lyase